MGKIDLQQLQAIVKAERAQAMGQDSSDLSEQRSKALRYYLGDVSDDLPAGDGRSAAVSTDVADAVESLMPSLMEVFAGGDDVVTFSPMGPEDEQSAREETDYINYLFMQRMGGFLVLYTYIKDALLCKNGIVKLSWETGKRVERERYAGLPDDAYALLLADNSLEIAEHEEVDGVAPGVDGTPAPAKLHNVTVIRRTEFGRPRVDPIPGEEFLISRRTRSIDAAPYCAHKRRITQSELIEEGYDREQVESLPDGVTLDTQEAIARQTVENDEDTASASMNRAMRLIDVYEHYIRVDLDGDGIAELVKVTTAGSGDAILRRKGKADVEPADSMPFESITPIIMPHRFFGRSFADLTIDLQRINTELTRGVLDNIYGANNNRFEVAQEYASDNTLDDLLTMRPGGIVRTKQPGGITPIPHNPLGPYIIPLLEMFDSKRETRTGITRYNQGLDANSLNKTAQGLRDVMGMAQQRMKLVARIMAETGIKGLFVKLHALLRKYETEPRSFPLRSKWLQVDPRNWQTRDDMTVEVGAGTNKDQEIARLMNILGLQKDAMQAGGLGMVSPKELYHTATRITVASGFKNPDLFFVDPQSPNAPQPPAPGPDPKTVELQQKAQHEQQKIALQTQAQQAKAATDLQIERERMQMEERLRIEEMNRTFALKKEQMLAEIALKREEIALRVPGASAVIPGSTVQLGGNPG